MALSKAVRRGTIAAALTLAAVALAAPAGAAGHRARLSADLADHLAFGSASIDVIVHGTRAEVDALAKKYNLRVKRYLRTGAVLRVTAGQLAALQEDDTQEHLSGDIPIYSTGDVTTQSIGADQVWAGAEGLPALSGAGVGVAVIDSGVDAKHNALKGRVTFTKDFTGGDGSDGYGHGTHVASMIAGRAGRTSDTSDYRGVASGARIINLRVLKDDGSGMASDVIEAVDFAVENKRELGIDVINLSLGAPVTQPYRDDPLCEAVERAVAAGIVVVVAAGNYGIDREGRQVYGSVATPGNDPSVITVGALDTHDTAIRSGRHDCEVQLAGADAVRPGAEAGPGGAGDARGWSRGSGIVPVEDVSRAARGWERRECLHPAVRHEHGGGGRERVGGVAAGAARAIDAARREGRAADDELVHAGRRTRSQRRWKSESFGCGWSNHVADSGIRSLEHSW